MGCGVRLRRMVTLKGIVGVAVLRDSSSELHDVRLDVVECSSRAPALMCSRARSMRVLPRGFS